MKKVCGVNPDFADFDELDADALDAVEEFSSGQLTFEELKIMVGTDAAEALKYHHFGEEFPEQFFDDPETL